MISTSTKTNEFVETNLDQDLPPAYDQFAHNAESPVSNKFSHHPMQLQCPKCNINILTEITFKTGRITWLVAGN